MGFAIPLKRVGDYALEELERAMTIASEPMPDAFGGGLCARLRTAEITIAFATADGSDASPATVVVSEAPLPAAQLRELLGSMDTPVLVARADVEHAPKRCVGRLVLRVIF